MRYKKAELLSPCLNHLDERSYVGHSRHNMRLACPLVRYRDDRPGKSEEFLE